MSHHADVLPQVMHDADKIAFFEPEKYVKKDLHGLLIDDWHGKYLHLNAASTAAFPDKFYFLEVYDDVFQEEKHDDVKEPTDQSLSTPCESWCFLYTKMWLTCN